MCLIPTAPDNHKKAQFTLRADAGFLINLTFLMYNVARGGSSTPVKPVRRVKNPVAWWR